ncbi:MAG: hypothetical protein FJZ63_02710 [Chlamydiae bacterium]|nr:hypothetical protein [Chlamydiota bacterium]
MLKQCTIFIDSLRDGRSLPIQEVFQPQDLDLKGLDQNFSMPIEVKGSTYLAEDHLVIQIDIVSSVQLPCSICNGPVTLPIALKNVYITKPLDEVSSGKVSFAEDLREALLLEAPAFTECNDGNCPERALINNYLKQSSPQTTKSNDNVYYPFDHLGEQLKVPSKGESHAGPKK